MSGLGFLYEVADGGPVSLTIVIARFESTGPLRCSECCEPVSGRNDLCVLPLGTPADLAALYGRVIGVRLQPCGHDAEPLAALVDGSANDMPVTLDR